MKTKLLMLTVAISCVFAGNAMALTKAEYKTQKDQISAEYKAGRDKCAAGRQMLTAQGLNLHARNPAVTPKSCPGPDMDHAHRLAVTHQQSRRKASGDGGHRQVEPDNEQDCAEALHAGTASLSAVGRSLWPVTLCSASRPRTARYLTYSSVIRRAVTAARHQRELSSDGVDTA